MRGVVKQGNGPGDTIFPGRGGPRRVRAVAPKWTKTATKKRRRKVARFARIGAEMARNFCEKTAKSSRNFAKMAVEFRKWIWQISWKMVGKFRQNGDPNWAGPGSAPYIKSIQIGALEGAGKVPGIRQNGGGIS